MLCNKPNFGIAALQDSAGTLLITFQPQELICGHFKTKGTFFFFFLMEVLCQNKLPAEHHYAFSLL